MKLKIALLAAAGSLAIASAANAQDEGYYGALGVGYTWSNSGDDFETNDEINCGDPSACQNGFVTNYDLDETYNFYGAFGKYLNYGFRTELELSHRNHNVDDFEVTGDGFAGFYSDGDIGDYALTALMANVIKEFEMEGWDMFFGVGLGVSKMDVDVSNQHAVPAGAIPPLNGMGRFSVAAGDQDYGLTGQLLAGLSYDLTETVDLDLKYRYLKTRTFEYGANFNGSSEYTDVEGAFSADELSVGLRWNFSQPEPVVVEEPAPTITYKSCWDGSRVVSTAQCPPRPIEEPEVEPVELDLTVYFDFDKSNLNEASRALIASRTAEALEYDVSSVNVEGNTDTVGSNAYNQALSGRRAAVVREALIANGIDPSIITTESLGETNLAEPTADGVREPLNRRTDVFFEF